MVLADGRISVRCNSQEELCSFWSPSLSVSHYLGLCPSFPLCFLLKQCCLQGQDWAGCFPTDYLDSERAVFKQRVIQTVLFDPQAKHTQNNRDSLCLSKKILLMITELGASIRHLNAQETAKIPLQGCGQLRGSSYTHKHTCTYTSLCRILYKCFLSNILSDQTKLMRPGGMVKLFCILPFSYLTIPSSSVPSFHSHFTLQLTPPLILFLFAVCSSSSHLISHYPSVIVCCALGGWGKQQRERFYCRHFGPLPL